MGPECYIFSLSLSLSLSGRLPPPTQPLLPLFEIFYSPALHQLYVSQVVPILLDGFSLSSRPPPSSGVLSPVDLAAGSVSSNTKKTSSFSLCGQICCYQKKGVKFFLAATHSGGSQCPIFLFLARNYFSRKINFMPIYER